MNVHTGDRAQLLGSYIVETGATVRAAAAKFNVSKSTVHKDVTSRLAKECPGLYVEVKRVLEQNKSERHIRGGLATRKKYKGS
jgi:putative DeoR family transcriptional regulator (stage III sporulation protein D)